MKMYLIGILWLFALVSLSSCSKSKIPPPPTPPEIEWSVWNGSSTEEITPAENIYIISNANQFAWFVQQVGSVSTFTKDKTFELEANIDLGEHPFSPIGFTADGKVNYFIGILDGKEHSIKGVNIDVAATDTRPYIGFFSGVLGTVKNLMVSGKVNSAVPTTFGVGGLAGCIQNGGVISGCTFSGQVKGVTAHNIGGVVGFLNGGEILGCTNKASVTCTFPEGTHSAKLGGVVGGIYPNNEKNISSLVAGCVNLGEVSLAIPSTAARIGGVVSEASGDGVAPLAGITVIACVNQGSLRNGYEVAGIACAVLFGGSNIVACYNTGVLDCSPTGAMNGVVRTLEANDNVNSCYWLKAANSEEFKSDQLIGTTTDMVQKSESELKSAATVNALNTAIASWNGANGDKCPYKFAVSADGKYPVLVKQ